MVQPANRDGEFVADLAPHRPLLGKLDVVGIGRGAPADETRLGGHKPQMVAIALAHRFADDGNFVRARFAPPRLATVAVRLMVLGCRYRRSLAELRKPRSECGFDHLRICCCELVLERKRPVCPGGKSVRSFELLELSDQLVPKAFGGVRR